MGNNKQNIPKKVKLTHKFKDKWNRPTGEKDRM